MLHYRPIITVLISMKINMILICKLLVNNACLHSIIETLSLQFTIYPLFYYLMFPE